jgi:hypothetical protein
MPFEYGGQTWPDTPWVIRERTVRLTHPQPDTVDALTCRYPNGQEITAYRESPVFGLQRNRQTLILERDENDIFTGTLRMHLIPGQPADGEVRCKAGTYGDNRAVLLNMNAYRAWKREHPDEEPDQTILWSDWSNSQPLGVVEPDPVPEPGLILLLAIGAVGLWIAGWRRKTR